MRVKCNSCGEEFDVRDIDEDKAIFCGKCIKKLTKAQRIGREEIKVIK